VSQSPAVFHQLGCFPILRLFFLSKTLSLGSWASDVLFSGWLFCPNTSCFPYYGCFLLLCCFPPSGCFSQIVGYLFTPRSGICSLNIFLLCFYKVYSSCFFNFPYSYSLSIPFPLLPDRIFASNCLSCFSGSLSFSNCSVSNGSHIHECTISLKFLGTSFRVLRLEVSVNNVYITNQFQTTFAQGGRGGE
jgi:hypothetical protein